MRLMVGGGCIDGRYVLKVNERHALHRRARWVMVVGWSRDGKVVARDERREYKRGLGWL